MGVQLETIPAGEGSHHHLCSSLEGSDIGRQVNLAQSGFIQAGISLVNFECETDYPHLPMCTRQEEEKHLRASPGRPTIAEIVLGCSQHRQRVVQLIALQAFDVGAGKLCHHSAVLSVPLISSAPTDVLGHSNRGSKIPINTGGSQLLCGGAPNAVNQIRITGSSQADIMREDHCAVQIVMTVYSIDPVQDRNTQASLQGGFLEIRQPFLPSRPEYYRGDSRLHRSAPSR